MVGRSLTFDRFKVFVVFFHELTAVLSLLEGKHRFEKLIFCTPFYVIVLHVTAPVVVDRLFQHLVQVNVSYLPTLKLRSYGLYRHW